MWYEACLVPGCVHPFFVVLSGSVCGEQVGREGLRQLFHERFGSEEAFWLPWACTSCNSTYTGPQICCEEEKLKHLVKQVDFILNWVTPVEQDKHFTTSAATKYVLDECVPPPAKKIPEIMNILLSLHGVHLSVFLNNSWVVNNQSKCICVSHVPQDLEAGTKSGLLLDLEGQGEGSRGLAKMRCFWGF